MIVKSVLEEEFLTLAEVKEMLSDCYGEAKRLLGEHADQHKALVDALLEHETLDEEDAYRIAGIERSPQTPRAGVRTIGTSQSESTSNS